MEPRLFRDTVLTSGTHDCIVDEGGPAEHIHEGVMAQQHSPCARARLVVRASRSQTEARNLQHAYQPAM